MFWPFNTLFYVLFLKVHTIIQVFIFLCDLHGITTINCILNTTGFIHSSPCYEVTISFSNLTELIHCIYNIIEK